MEIAPDTVREVLLNFFKDLPISSMFSNDMTGFNWFKLSDTSVTPEIRGGPKLTEAVSWMQLNARQKLNAVDSLFAMFGGSLYEPSARWPFWVLSAVYNEIYLHAVGLNSYASYMDSKTHNAMLKEIAANLSPELVAVDQNHTYNVYPGLPSEVWSNLQARNDKNSIETWVKISKELGSFNSGDFVNTIWWRWMRYCHHFRSFGLADNSETLEIISLVDFMSAIGVFLDNDIITAAKPDNLLNLSAIETYQRLALDPSEIIESCIEMLEWLGVVRVLHNQIIVNSIAQREDTSFERAYRNRLSTSTTLVPVRFRYFLNLYDFIGRLSVQMSRKLIVMRQNIYNDIIDELETTIHEKEFPTPKVIQYANQYQW